VHSFLNLHVRAKPAQGRKMKPISDHNDFYLTEDRRHQPREFFKFLKTLAAPWLEVNPTASVFDVGCANGEFLYYLRSCYPRIQAAGVDINDRVLAKARQIVPDGRFRVANIESGENLPSEKFDLVFMSGVNYLLSDHERWLRNLIALSRQAVFVFGVFNPEDLDFRATVSRPGNGGSCTPWNLVSRRSISLFLDHLEPGMNHRFHNWEIPVDNPRVHVDPMRTWTVRTDQGRRLQINGLQIVHTLAVLEVEVRRNTARRSEESQRAKSLMTAQFLTAHRSRAR
jgi:SAM-dependent methyltransferase